MPNVIMCGHTTITPPLCYCDVINIAVSPDPVRRGSSSFSSDIMGFKAICAEKRGIIIYLHKQGKSIKFIAKECGLSRTGVRGVLKRWKETGESKCKPRPGRTRKSTTTTDRTLVRLSLSNRKLTSSELSRDLRESTGTKLSAPTVRRRLLENGLRGCEAICKPLLSDKQRKRRLEWARSHVHWPVEKWHRVLFSDESTFTVNNHAGNNYVRRRPKEQYRPYCISPTIKHPQSIMVWGCMAANGVGRLEVVSGMMNGTKYIDVLERKMLPRARSLFSDNQWIFQDDNAPCHRAKKVQKWYESHQVERMEWPAQSPDLNPIENLWYRISCIISKNKPKTKRELIEQVIAAWLRVISPEELTKLVDSLPRRCKMVIENKGWPTKY